MPTDEEITQHSDLDPDGVVWVGDRPPLDPIVVVDPDPSWPAQYVAVASRIRAALGDRVIDLDHVGSTSVPDLPAKPVIDVDLTVADPGDEAAYVPDLAPEGFRLLLREPAWHGHRLLVSDSPRTNLHVWGPGSPEVVRHRMFRDRLIGHASDRSRYVEAKRAAAAATNIEQDDVMAYNQHKQAVIRDILDRTFRAHGMS